MGIAIQTANDYDIEPQFKNRTGGSRTGAIAIQTSSNTLPPLSDSAPASQKSNRVTFIKKGMKNTGI